TRGLPHGAHPRCTAAGEDGVLVGALGVLVEQAARHHHVPTDDLRQGLGEAVQFTADLRIELLEGRLGCQRGAGLAGLTPFALATRIAAGTAATPMAALAPVAAGRTALGTAAAICAVRASAGAAVPVAGTAIIAAP